MRTMLAVLLCVAVLALTGGTPTMTTKPIGAPDFQRTMVLLDPENIWRSRNTIGLTETAARLGCVSKYERRGNVLLIDEFQNGLNAWTTDVSGTGSSVALTAAGVLDGSYAAKMTTGSDTFLSATIYTYFALLDLEYPMGLETAYKWAADAGDYMMMSLVMYDGTTRYSYTIKIDRDDGRMFVRQEPATDTQFALLGVSQASGWYYHRIKLVIDHGNRKYLRLYYDENEYDLSAYVPDEVLQATPPRARLVFAFYGTALQNDAATLNHVILTTNEPVI